MGKCCPHRPLNRRSIPGNDPPPGCAHTFPSAAKFPVTGYLDLKSTWGPFSPCYLGISHILDASEGSMADLPLFVGRRAPASLVLPDSSFDHVQNMSDGDRRAKITAMPENVSEDYSTFGVRYFLDPHGDTALARFVVENGARTRCEITFENSSGESREYFFGFGLTVSDARRKVRLKASLLPWWIAARGYSRIEAYQKTFALGCRQCLSRVFSWGVEEEVLAQAFGGWAEDRVTYQTTLPKPLEEGFLYFRYIKYSNLNPAWEVRINNRAHVFHFPQTWSIPGGGWGKNRDAYEEWRLLRVPVGKVPETSLTVELRCLEAPGNDMSRIWLDGMLFSEGLLPGDEGELSRTALVEEPLRAGAGVQWASTNRTEYDFRIVIPGETDRRLTIALDQAAERVSDGTGSIVDHLRREFGLPPGRLTRDANAGPWSMLQGAPVVVPPRSARTSVLTISMAGESPPPPARLAADRPACCGPYSEMAARLRDILLFNVNYPLRLLGKPSHYCVPAKYFPIPYSWDGGLAAVGLATFAQDLAWQQASYFLAEDGHDFPLLYCGSPVPTSLYALWDAYQETQNLAELAGTYAGARRMYDFYLGRTPGSTVNAGRDGFLSTYAYNYNLGIDDHPIQRWAEECHLTNKGLYSIILMPQILRMAGIMQNIAILLDRNADAEQFRQDATLLGDIIETRMWDEKSGLYGWLRRTETGVEPVVFQGCAGDRSACAFLPLFAGLTGHKERLIAQMMDPARFLTPFGISSVDMLAPSYNPHGYWNGGIWPVLQWFLWRGLLEAGEPVLARQVAEAILKTWKRFFESEHYFGEHFMIASEQMNGAPNFGGLSGVLLPMCAAYFSAYHVTALYDVAIIRKNVDREQDTLSLTLRAPCLSKPAHCLLVNMGHGNMPYTAFSNGAPIGDFVSDECGHLSLTLPRPAGEEELLFAPSTKMLHG